MTFPGEYRTANTVLAQPETDRWGLRAPLEALGHRVLDQAVHAPAAAELIVRLDPELVVMDAHLLDAGGPAGGARAETWRRAALVLVASEWDESSLQAAVGAGAVACLIQPVRVDQLGLSIQIGLARHAELAALRSTQAQLEQQRATGRHLAQAKGILMQRLGVGEGEAHLLLHHRARSTRRTLTSAIEEVLMADRFFMELERSVRRPWGSEAARAVRRAAWGAHAPVPGPGHPAEA